MLTRAAPLLTIAALAFGGGVIVGGGTDLPAAERFGEAWERGDFAAMHGELTAAARDEFDQAEFEREYAGVEATATVERVDVGDPAEVEGPNGEPAAALPVTLHTSVFGEIEGEVVLPLADGLVAWEPHLAFPGLEAEEELERRSRVPERAPILAADGTPLAEGPASARSSPLGPAAFAVSGSVELPKRAQAAELERLGYPPGGLAGTSGLELAFNQLLSGEPGGQLVAVGDDAERIVASARPGEGKPLRTTIDPALQQAAVSALGGTFGGIAVLDARKGSVLALAGVAFSAPQPPGSTFKVLTATAALDEGIVEPADEFPVLTSTVVGGREIANAHDEPCGGTFVETFAHSCNTVFAPLGAELGGETLVDYSERFGFNERPSLYHEPALDAVDPPESSIPTELESDLEAGVSAIGQGEVLATPLRMASMAQTIASGGTRHPTSLVRDPELRADAEPVRVTSRETAATVRDLMVEVVRSGTGTAAALPGIEVAGKTGTAELGPAAAPEPGAEPEQEVDAWFLAFAPAGDPRLAIAVMVVNAAGDGGEVAAPIAREVLAAGLG